MTKRYGKDPFEEFARTAVGNPFWPNMDPDDILLSEESVVQALRLLFEGACARFDEDKVRLWFAQLGREPKKTTVKNARLLFQLYNMHKPNVSDFARKLAKSDDGKDTFDAKKRQIERALKDRAAWKLACAADRMFGDGGTITTERQKRGRPRRK